MFYFHDVLKKRGKFGVIWLAATVPKRLSKRDVFSVDIARSSNDVIEILTQHPTISGHKKVRFSLYLSSQLMYGLFFVHQMKAAILLEDLKHFAGRIGTFRRDLPSSIDLVEPASGFRVTFEEPDLENAPIDFGSLSITGTSPVYEPSYEYFIVSTPRSPDEWQISPGLPPDYQIRLPDISDEHTARPEDVTMHEDIPLQSDGAPVQAEEAFEIPGGLSDDFLEEPVSFFATQPVVPESEREVLEGVPEVDDQQQISDFAPPDVTVRVAEPPADRAASAAGAADFMPSPRPDRPRSSSDQPELPFVLQPIVIRDRRGRTRHRRRHLIIDRVIRMSSDQMMRNLNTGNYHHVRQHDVIDLQESAESLLTRFGLRAAARGNRRFWRNPKTLPEPNDPSPFCLFREEELEDMVSRGVREPEISEGEQQRTISREEPRAEETLDDTHGLSTTSKTFPSLQRSRTLQDMQDLSAASRHSLNAPVIDNEDLSRREDVEMFEDMLVEPVIPEAVIQPQALSLEPEIEVEEQTELEVDRDISTTRRETCVVSPEKTPPPLSPEKPSSPLTERTMIYIREAFEDSDVITFTTLIRKTPGTRRYIAKLFSNLLELHAALVIVMEQPVPEGGILITKGDKYY